MQFYIMAVGLLLALVGQWLNSQPHVDSRLVKLGLAVGGILAYLAIEQPAAWAGPVFFEWLDKAWLWALAVPGAASLIGLAPGMATKTNNQGG